MAETRQKLTVEIWSDVVCPWCWIGQIRFQEALDRFDHADQVEVIHHSFRLMPGVPPRPVTEIMSAKMGIPASQVPAALRQVEDVAATVGLTYRLADTSTGDSLDAHLLIKFAIDAGKGDEMLSRLYRAYLSEQISVFDRDSLIELAAGIGLDADEARTAFTNRTYQGQVEGNQRALGALGGNGVPFFLIGGKFTVSGAQSPEVFVRALNQGWEQLPKQPVVLGDGAVCGPDGCAIP